MKLFTPKKHEPPRAGTDVATTLAEISRRLEKLERVITDLKQNVDLLPAVVRKLYLDGAELTPPYDLLTERFSYLSQNDLRVHFGLGAAARADRLEVRWPSGLVEEWKDLAADRILRLVEGTAGEGAAAPARPD